MIQLDMTRVNNYATPQNKRVGAGGGTEMIKFKTCPKCRGDLYLSEDIFGKYLSCLQCGYLKDVEEPVMEAAVSSGAPSEKQQRAA
jgi:predicted  nucleic acid-binding Zn ribbon protein